LLIFVLFFNIDIETGRSNPKRPADIIVWILGVSVTLATLLPVIIGLLAGGGAIMMGV
jgi:hypothetical protein